jgi:Predicted pPIWI-associating nuclease
MTQRVTLAQLQSVIRQAEAKQRQAVNEHNAAMRRLQTDVQRAVNDHTGNVRRAQRAIDDYNRAARAHNASVQANRQRLQAEIARLNSQPSPAHFTITRTSTVALHAAYRRVEEDYDAGVLTSDIEPVVDLAGAEATNSAHVANALLGQPSREDLDAEDTALTDELSSLSIDLDRRWRGALFALNPRNPDAARHFCASSREVIAQMIDLRAPDSVVFVAKSGCKTTETGRPVRREKLDYLLAHYGTNQNSLGEFVDTDVNDVMGLFRLFNDGAHGSAGKFDMPTLRAIKTRVEGSIRFLSTVIRGMEGGPRPNE